MYTTCGHTCTCMYVRVPGYEGTVHYIQVHTYIHVCTHTCMYIHGTCTRYIYMMRIHVPMNVLLVLRVTSVHVHNICTYIHVHEIHYILLHILHTCMSCTSVVHVCMYECMYVCTHMWSVVCTLHECTRVLHTYTHIHWHVCMYQYVNYRYGINV